MDVDEAKAAVKVAEEALTAARRAKLEARRAELVEGLTDQEREAAQRMGMSPESYSLWKGVRTGQDAERVAREEEELAKDGE